MARKKKANVLVAHVGPYRHPGIPARPFLRPALEKGFRLLKAKLPGTLRQIKRGADFETALSTLTRTAASYVAIEASRLAPKDTGHLRGNINVRMITPVFAVVGTNVKYAPYQEFGTKPFTMPMIRPKNKRCLAWYDAAKAEMMRASRRGGGVRRSGRGRA